MLSPINNEGNEMEEAVMNEKVRLIPCCTISKLRKDEIFSETEKQEFRLFED